MQAKLYNQLGEEAGTIEVPAEIFDAPRRLALIKQVVGAERANRRRTLAHTKDRGEVRGGGKKPWRQKHTGRARHGSIRSPLWRGGGITFGPRTERVFSKKINKKAGRLALFSVLSEKYRGGEIIFIDDIRPANAKTKEFAEILKKFPMAGKSVGLIGSGDKNVERAARNIDRLSIFPAQNLNALDLLSKKFVLFPQNALSIMEKAFLKQK